MASDQETLKLEGTTDDSGLKDTASAHTPVDDNAPKSTLGTIPKTMVGLQTHKTELDESEGETKSESSRGETVGWVYNLKKHQLIEELGKCGLNTNGKSDELRKRYVEFLRTRDPIKFDGRTGPKTDGGLQSRTANLSQVPTPPLDISLPLMDEAISIREILGLSPNADVNTVKRVLTSVVNTTSYNTDPATNPQMTSREWFPGQSLATDNRVTFLGQGNPYNQVRTPQAGVNVNREVQSLHDPLSNKGMSNLSANREIRPANHSCVSDFTQTYSVNREIRSVSYPVVSDTTQNYHSTAMICNIVRKWNISYDGDRNPITFLERLGELMECYNVAQDDLIRALPEILKGKALLWYRNNRELWRNFSDFQRSFELQYLPPGYSKNLDDEIRLRTQGEDEPFRDFLVAILTLIRRRGGYSLQGKIDRIYQNMKPEYIQSVRRERCNSIQDLIQEAEHFESYERAKRLYRPPPSPSQTLVPETAYYGKNRTQRQFSKVETVNVRPDFRNQEMTSFPRTDEQRRLINQMRRPNYPPGQQRPYFNPQRIEQTQNEAKRNTDQAGFMRPPQNERPPKNDPPKEQRTENQIADQPTTATDNRPQENRPLRRDAIICWNCEEEGHRSPQCRKPTVIRCYYCRKVGIRTIHCQCRQGNDLGNSV